MSKNCSGLSDGDQSSKNSSASSAKEHEERKGRTNRNMRNAGAVLFLFGAIILGLQWYGEFFVKEKVQAYIDTIEEESNGQVSVQFQDVDVPFFTFIDQKIAFKVLDLTISTNHPSEDLTNTLSVDSVNINSVTDHSYGSVAFDGIHSPELLKAIYGDSSKSISEQNGVSSELSYRYDDNDEVVEVDGQFSIDDVSSWSIDVEISSADPLFLLLKNLSGNDPKNVSPAITNRKFRDALIQANLRYAGFDYKRYEDAPLPHFFQDLETDTLSSDEIHSGIASLVHHEGTAESLTRFIENPQNLSVSIEPERSISIVAFPIILVQASQGINERFVDQFNLIVRSNTD